jgi:signal transduction histidine kinase
LLTTALVAESLREEARRQELEKRTQAARGEALQAFLQIASHDLKSPLTCIQLSAFMLDRLDLPDVARSLTSTIRSSGARAQALIRTYLEISSVEGKLRLDRGDVDLTAAIAEEIELLRLGTDEHQLLPSFHNNTAGIVVFADESKLRQVLANLLSNAAKYSPDGRDVTIEADLASEGFATLRIRDQGVGIAANDQEELFLPFRRLGKRGLVEGTGLGLWLSRALVEAHGGRIWVESNPDGGSTFSFTLPQPSAVVRS